jgi:hypothetical protein
MHRTTHGPAPRRRTSPTCARTTPRRHRWRRLLLPLCRPSSHGLETAALGVREQSLDCDHDRAPRDWRSRRSPASCWRRARRSRRAQTRLSRQYNPQSICGSPRRIRRRVLSPIRAKGGRRDRRRDARRSCKGGVRGRRCRPVMSAVGSSRWPGSHGSAWRLFGSRPTRQEPALRDCGGSSRELAPRRSTPQVLTRSSGA